MNDPRNALFVWLAQGRLKGADLPQAMRLAGITPDGAHWRCFADRLLLVGGILFLVVGGACLMLAQWETTDRLIKLGLSEVALVVAIAVCVWSGLDAALGRGALVAAVLLTGVLFALVGLIYPMGADEFDFFLLWAAAVLPWVALARMSWLWLGWLGLLNLAVTAYRSGAATSPLALGIPPLVALFILNAVALAVWEYFAARGAAWLRAAWPHRALVLAAGWIISIAASLPAEPDDIWRWLALVLYVAWLGVVYCLFRRLSLDLLVLGAALLSLAWVAAEQGAMLAAGQAELSLVVVMLALSGVAIAGGKWLHHVAQKAPPS